VFDHGAENLHCILEPTTSRSWQNMRRFITDLGELPQGQFEYVGDTDISAAEYLERDGKVYLPRRCEPIYLAGKCICYWGLAVPAGEESAWNN